MENRTYEQRAIELGKNASTRNECYVLAQSLVGEIMNTDDRLWSINRNWETYGTWRITLWMNEYEFGRNFAAHKFSIITHDEDAKFSIKSFEEDINDYVSEIVTDAFDGEYDEEEE